MKFKAKQYWDTRSDEWTSTKHYNEAEAAEIEAFLDLFDSSIVLVADLGCGTAPYFNLFTNRDLYYVGTDVSNKQVKWCLKTHPSIMFLVEDLKNLSVKADLAFCGRSLMNVPTEYFPEVAKRINENFKYALIIDFREDVNNKGEAPQSQYHKFSEHFKIIDTKNLNDLNKIMWVQCNGKL